MVGFGLPVKCGRLGSLWDVEVKKVTWEFGGFGRPLGGGGDGESCERRWDDHRC